MILQKNIHAVITRNIKIYQQPTRHYDKDKFWLMNIGLNRISFVLLYRILGFNGTVLRDLANELVKYSSNNRSNLHLIQQIT